MSTSVSVRPDDKPKTGLYLTRRLFRGLDPLGLTADQWRSVVSKAPVARTCIETLTMQLASVPWHITGRDAGEVDYYTELLRRANGEDFDTFTARVVADTLQVPMGGLIEPVRDNDGTLVDILHVDGGTVFPTYDPALPFVQFDPEDSLRRAYFKPGQIVRLMWMPMEGLKNYYWTRPPVMDCLGPMISLVHTDQFWSSFISDTPPPGILVLPDFSRSEAEEWATSFKTLYEGIDKFKIPIIYDHKGAIQWINFSRSPGELSIEQIAKRYTELVASVFGVSLSEIALYEHSVTLAGASRLLQNRKGRGIGSLIGKLTATINSVLPSTVQFWMELVEEEDKWRAARTFKLRVDGVTSLVEKGIYTAEEGKAQLIADGILRAPDELQAVTSTTEEIEDLPNPAGSSEAPERSASWIDPNLLVTLQTGVLASLVSLRFYYKDSELMVSPVTCSGLSAILTAVYKKGKDAALIDLAPATSNLLQSPPDKAVAKLCERIDQGTSLRVKDLQAKILNNLHTTRARARQDRMAVLKAVRLVCTSEERAATIALNEYVEQWNLGYLEVLRSAGDVRKTWQTEEGCCPVCTANKSLGPIPLSTPFLKANGMETQAPSAHLGCLCALRVCK